MTFKISPSTEKLPRYMSPPSRCGSMLGGLVPAVLSNNGHVPSVRVALPSAPVVEYTTQTVHVYENGVISGRLILLHNESKSLEVTVAPGKDGDEMRISLAAIDGMSVVVHTSAGTFTLAYPDVDKTLVFYNERWNVFGWNSLTYSFFPEKVTQTLTAPNNTIGFGYDVECSSDATVIAIGSPETSNGAGCVYIYTKKDTGLELAQVLTGGTTGMRKEEGRVCVMNALGTVVGFNSKNADGDDTFVIFEKNNSQWRLCHIIEDACTDADISSSGTTLVLASPQCIRIYAYSSDGWSHVADLEEQGDNVFGKRVALSGNGHVVATVSEKHTAIIYNISTQTPVRHQLSDSGITGAVSVATDFSGTTVVVGSDDTHGRICVFTSPVTHGRYAVRPDPNFDKENIINNLFGVGHSVDLSADGNTMVVGAPKYKGTNGAVFVFTRTVGVWTLRSKIIGTAGAVLGYSIAAASDASHAVIGAIGNAGSVYIIS